MIEYFKNKPVLADNLLWLLWAVGLAACFPTYNVPFLAWFIFIPVLVYTYRNPIYKTVRYAFLYGLVFWLATTYWLVAFHEAALPTVSPIYSIYYAFTFFLIAYVSRYAKKFRWLAVPVFWVAMEFIRSSGYAGFKWNLLADSQFRNLFMIQSADIWGPWGVSFLIMLCNSVLAELVDKWIEGGFRKAVVEHRGKLIVAGSILVANFVYGVITYHYYDTMSQNAPKEKLALLQPDIGSFEDWWGNLWDNYAIFWKLNAEAAIQDPDIIVWSESMIRHIYRRYWCQPPMDSKAAFFNYLCYLMPKDFGTEILLTYPAQMPNRNAYNSAELMNPFDGTGQFYAKIHLVPFGEWMPYYQKIPFVKTVIEQAGAAAYTPWTNFTVMHSAKAKFGVMVCFEDIFEILARRFAILGVNYFINTTNDGWAYRWEVGSDLPLWQHTTGATFTAISVRRPIARAVNTGVTCVIDLTGKTAYADTPIYHRGLFVHDISIIDGSLRTIYVRFGYVFPYVVMLAALAAMAGAVFFGKPQEAE